MRCCLGWLEGECVDTLERESERERESKSESQRKRVSKSEREREREREREKMCGDYLGHVFRGVLAAPRAPIDTPRRARGHHLVLGSGFRVWGSWFKV